MSFIKVLIIEDSSVIAELLTYALQSDPQIRVVGVAANGREAQTLLPRLAPHVVTLDVYTPVLDSFATVEWIMANYPTPILVITGGLQEDVRIGLRLLEAGALDVIEKPLLHDERQWQRHKAEIVARVRLLAEVRVVTHVRGKQAALVLPAPPKNLETARRPAAPAGPPAVQATRQLDRTAGPDFPPDPHYQVIALASSTGGPTALLAILQNLPANLPCGLLVVQHISEGFTQGLVEWLQRETPLKLRIATGGERPAPGTALVAPDRLNMLAGPDRRVVITDDGHNYLRPNADSLLGSVARAYRQRAIGVVLTGMGQDGAAGLKAMYDLGGYTIAQDEATSLIYGMPRAAREAGAVRAVLPLAAIAPRLLELCRLPYQPADNYNLTRRLLP